MITLSLISKESKKCNALFITSDKIAVTVIKALKNHGISVPEGMSIIGFDGLKSQDL